MDWHRSWSIHRIVAALALAIGLSGLAAAAPVLVAIGSDSNGVGRVLVPISPAASGVALGDGTVAFNGGLAYRSPDDRLYSIANDRFGSSSLVRFAPASPATLLGSIGIGTGFFGGLAYDATSDALYAIASDSAAQSSLYRIDPTTGGTTDLGVLGYGYFGGLTFDTDLGALVAISGDAFGVPRSVQRIDLSGPTASATFLFDLGDGSLAFNGGLAYDGDSRRFLSIANDFLGNSMLYAFTTTASSLTLLDPALGRGFLNVGLAFSSAIGSGGGTVPEPATWILLTLPALAWRLSKHRLTRSHKT